MPDIIVQSVTMSNETDRCHKTTHIDNSESPLISATMFAAGIIGNVAALVILEVRRRRQRRRRMESVQQRGLFHTLILSLVFTDLAGTCSVSPVVQLAYGLNRSLVGMGVAPNSTPDDPSPVCNYFGMSMTFFSLATISLLLATALDRCFAIGFPYLYSSCVSRKWAGLSVLLIFLFSLLFSLVPFAGFGVYVQYCPGTWCFIDMNPEKVPHRVFSYLYASIMLVLVASILACNIFVMIQLLQMYRRRSRHGSLRAPTSGSTERRTMSMSEEVEHLILLVLMTIIFIICTLPLVVRVYINSTEQKDSHDLDLDALRFLAINPIVDPWVFIFAPPTLHFFWGSVCAAPRKVFRGSVCKPSLTLATQLELSRPSLSSDEVQSEEPV